MYIYDTFIAYHGTCNKNGSMKKALKLYNFLIEKNWNPYMYQAMETDRRFTDTPELMKHCETFILVINEHILIVDNEIASIYIREEISSFCADEEKLKESLTAYVMKGTDMYLPGHLSAFFNVIPLFDKTKLGQKKAFLDVDTWMAKQLGYRRIRPSIAPLKVSKPLGLFKVITFIDSMKFNQGADQKKRCFHCSPDVIEDFKCLLKQMMIDSYDEVKKSDMKDLRVSFLLHLGGISEEFLRFFFVLAFSNQSCHDYLPYLLDIANKNNRRVFINYFAKTNQDMEIYPDFLPGGKTPLTYNPKLNGHNENKMRLTSFEKSEPPFDYSFTYSTVRYSDYIKYSRLDYPFIDRGGKKVTMRQKYVYKYSEADLIYPQKTLDLPNECGCGVFIITSDNYLILQKRTDNSNLMFYPSTFSYSSCGSIDMDKDNKKDGSFIPENGIKREANEELGTNLGACDLHLMGYGFDNDIMFYQFSFLALSPFSLNHYLEEVEAAQDGIGREIDDLYSIDLLKLFEGEENCIPEEYSELLNNSEQWEHASFYNLRRMLTSKPVEDWVISNNRPNNRRVIKFSLPNFLCE